MGEGLFQPTHLLLLQLVLLLVLGIFLGVLYLALRIIREARKR